MRTIIATSLGFVLVQLDVSIVNIGLARIGTSLGIGVTSLEWIVDAYTLTFAALMLSAGAIADRIGARRTFILGFGLFVAASAACGLAPGAATLIIARAVQGAGAAALVPASLALLNHSCQGDDKARAHAVGLWTAAGSVALAAGPVLGGLLIDHIGWRSIFLINLPIGLAGIAMTRRWVAETQPGTGALDAPGQTLGIIALATITAAVIQAGAAGWATTPVIALLATGIAATAVFLRTEARASHPMLPLAFFRLPGFAPATVVGFVINFTLYGAIFTLNLFLQRIAGLSPSESGLAFLPFPVALFAANVSAGALVARFGPRAPMTCGLIIGAVGFALLLPLDAATPWPAMIPGLAMIPAGIGIAVPAMTTALLTPVPRSRSGVASGVLNTVRQAGGAIGVALSGGFLAHDGASGMHRSFLLATGLLLAAALLAFLRMTAGAASNTDPARRQKKIRFSTIPVSD